MAAVHPRGFLQLSRKRLKKLLKYNAGHRNSRNIEKQHSGQFIQETHLFQHQEHRKDCHLHRNHHTKQQITGQQIFSLKFITRNSIGHHGGQDDTANRAAHRENQAVSKIPDEVVFKQYLFVGFKGDAGGNGNKAFQKIAPGFYRIHQRHHGDKDRNAGIDNQKNRDRPAEDFSLPGEHFLSSSSVAFL